MAGGISPTVQSEVSKWQPQFTNIIFGVLILVIIVYSPAGLNGLWLRLKRTVTRWPYTT
jgi:hypothetical protein